MSKRAKEAALKAYPVNMTPLVYQDLIDQFGGKTEIDVNTYPRCLFQGGYEQGEKDAIEMAVTWITNNACFYTDMQNDEEGYLKEVFLEKSFICAFKKAMENE